MRNGSGIRGFSPTTALCCFRVSSLTFTPNSSLARLVQLLRQFVKLTLQAMAFNKWAEARSLAVIRIQASVRSFLGLKEARTRQHERRRRHGAATKIQALHRGNAGRAACIHRRRRYVAAVLVIQRCARIFLARAAVENKVR